MNATRPPLSPFEWLRDVATSTEPLFGVSRSLVYRLVLVAVALQGGRALLQGVEAATEWLPGRAARVAALEPVPTDRDRQACASADCTLPTIRPRRIADDAGLQVAAAARLVPEPAVLVAFAVPLPLGRYGLDHAASWGAQGRFVNGVARWSVDLQYMRSAGAHRIDVERPPPGSGLPGRVERPVDGPGLVERFVPLGSDRPSIGPADVPRLLASEDDGATGGERFVGFDFRALPNPVRVRLEPGRHEAVTDGDPVRVHVGGADPQRPGFEGRLEDVAREADGSVRARVRVTDQDMMYLSQTIARGLQDLGPRRAEWPLSIDIDRRFGNPGAARWWVPADALVRRDADGDATLWVVIEGFAVPVAVAVVAERDGDCAVVERRFPGTTSLRPADWRALTAVQRATLIRRTVAFGARTLVGDEAPIVARPAATLRPGARVRAA